MIRRLSIQPKPLPVLLLVSLTLVAAGSYMSYLTGTEAATEAVHRQLASVLKAKAGLLRVMLGNYRDQITSFAASPTASFAAAPDELGRTPLEFARGELLLWEGDQQDGLCLLAEGEAVTMARGPDGPEKASHAALRAIADTRVLRFDQGETIDWRQRAVQAIRRRA